MSALKQYRLLIIGLVVILASAFLLAQANAKQAECESMTGKIVQLFDMHSKESCSQVKIIQFIAYGGIAIGIALVVVQFVRQV